MLELTYRLQAALTSSGEKAGWLHESAAVDTQSLCLKNPLCTTMQRVLLLHMAFNAVQYLCEVIATYSTDHILLITAQVT